MTKPMRLYATRTRKGVYVTLGTTPEEARALADTIGLALGEKKNTDKWTVEPVTLTRGHGEG